MIWIFSSDRARVNSFDDFDDLFWFISDKEKLKFQENHPEFGQIPWSFTLFTTQQVSAIYTNTQKSLLTEIVKKAYEQEVGFIEICKGDFKNCIEILNTPDIDMEALKKQWCLEYWNTHRYIVVETLSQPFPSEQTELWSETFNLYITSFQKLISTIENPPNFLVGDFIDEVDTDLHRTLWRDQLVNSPVRKSLIEQSLSAY